MLDFETWREEERERRANPRTLEDLVREGPPPINWELDGKTLEDRFDETPSEVLARISYSFLISYYLTAGFTEGEAERFAEETVQRDYDNGAYTSPLSRNRG